jgi:hypothetical protein
MVTHEELIGTTISEAIDGVSHTLVLLYASLIVFLNI